MGKSRMPCCCFTRRDAQTEATRLYVLNADTGEETLLTEIESFYRADWLPDGRIGVVDNVSWEEDQGRFRFFDPETGDESVLSENLILNVDQCHPALLWSPDGQSLAYSTGTVDGRVLHLQHTLTQSSNTVPFPQDEYLAEWSDDGAYIRVDVGSQDRLLAAEDGSEVLVAENIQFSLDERLVGYRENEQIWLYDLASGERLNLDIRGQIWAWLPTNILIRSEGDEILWRYDIETQELTSLEVDMIYDLYLTGSFVSVSPDER